MNRREFLKISCSGLITLYLSGCGLNVQSGQNKHPPQKRLPVRKIVR